MDQYGPESCGNPEFVCHWLCQCVAGQGIERLRALAEPVAPEFSLLKHLAVAGYGPQTGRRPVPRTLCVTKTSAV